MNITAKIKGFDHHLNKSFESKAEFTLLKPEQGTEYYGTGCYMRVVFNERGNEELIDVRYEGTTDIKELASRFIKNWYGDNAESVTFAE